MKGTESAGLKPKSDSITSYMFLETAAERYQTTAATFWKKKAGTFFTFCSLVISFIDLNY